MFSPAALAALLLLAAGPPPATKGAAVRFADEVLVTATATPRARRDLPYAVSVVEADDPALAELRSLPEAMRELPGVFVQRTTHGQGSPFLRGFTGFRTVFLVDGVRLDHSAFRDGPNQYAATVDPWSLERLEVVRGPASVLYGSDAVGGAVQVFTRRPAPEGAVSARLRTRWASAESSRVARFEVDARAGRLLLTAGATGRDFGDLEAGGDSGSQPRTGYEELDADAKLVADLGAAGELVLAYQRVGQDDVWRTHRTAFAVPFRGTVAGDERRHSFDQERELAYLQWRDEVAGGFARRLADRLHASLSYQRHDEDRLRVRADGRSDREGFSVGTTGLWVRAEKASGIGVLGYGLELYRDRVSSFSRRFAADGGPAGVGIQGPIGDDARYALWGAFLQDEVLLSRRTTLVLGLRATRAEADARRVQDPVSGRPTAVAGSWDELTGSVRWLRRVRDGDRLRVFAGVSQAFRAPNLSDLTRFDVARSDEVETPSPDLEPERFLGFELGLAGSGPRGEAEAALFWTELDGLIVRAPTGRLVDGGREVTKRNAGDGFVRGIELAARFRPAPGWSLFGNATWLDGEADAFPTSAPLTAREPIDRLMPPTAHLGVRWEGERPWAELLLTAVGRQDELSTQDRRDVQRIPPEGTPGYAVVTLRGGLRLPGRIAVWAALENLGDVAYRVHGSGLNEAGRSLLVGLDVGL